MVGGNFFGHDPVGKAGEGEPFGHDEIDFHPGFVGRESVDEVVRQNFKTRIVQQPDRLSLPARIEITGQDHGYRFLADLLQERFALRNPQVLPSPIVMDAEQTELSPMLSRIDTHLQSASWFRPAGQDVNLMR